MTEVLKEYEFQIGKFVLVPSDGGRFEFIVNGELIYSKLKEGRHVNPGEVPALLRTYIEENQA